MNKSEIIKAFYSAFQEGNAEKMVEHYHENITFQDPAFGVLKGEEAKNMWRMLLSRASDLELSFHTIKEEGNHGSANWEAKYTFSKTGRKVHNKIAAYFEFEGDKIIRHTDEFNFWKWSQMALGPMGLLLGFTPIIKNKVRSTALKSLAQYTEARKA